MTTVVRYFDAAGLTGDEFLDFSAMTVLSVTDSLMRMRMEITDGSLAGFSMVVSVYGDFNAPTPEDISIDRMVMSVNGDRVMSIDFGDFFSGLAFDDAFGGGIKYIGNTFANILEGDRGRDQLFGGGGNDKLFGFSSNDKLFGEGGIDRLFGGGGNDTVSGGAGRDKIFGNGGADKLFGGTHADDFFFRSINDSRVGALRDVIKDFEAGLDEINLSKIDANTLLSGNDAFSFIGADLFDALAGQLRYSNGIVQGDVDGDGVADFEIKIAGGIDLTASDFVL